jgi:hypothetical protein
MKKSTRKLVVRREIIRTLASMDLARAAGGEPPETGERACTATVLADTGDKVCTTLAIPLPSPG